MSRNKKKLVSRKLKIDQLNPSQKERMYEIFGTYYNNVSKLQFDRDLEKKDIVFLLLDGKTKVIQGFSTLVNLSVRIDGKKVRGCFSGDTIIEREYWGQGTLGVAFLKHLFIQKMKRPWENLYWFLISKGYKTYLLMANNFSEHYPRYEKSTPMKETQILESFSKALYGEYFSPKTGIISFSKSVDKDKLKQEITPITKELLLQNPRIKYFADKNPDWEIGHELACIAKMTFSMPVKYQTKFLIKRIRKAYAKLLLKTKVEGEA